MPLNKCGTCRYAIPTKQTNPGPFNLDCHGFPPTPQLVGGGQDALGRNVFQVELLVPRVAPDRVACSVYMPADGVSVRLS